jgi:hypothetical protein
MCDFVSWVEIPNQDGTKSYYYLTDKEVYSPYGKKVFGDGAKDNDFLGHGAIRAFYASPDGTPLKGGDDREVKDFWNLNQLPPEIAKLVSEFDKHWGKMWKNGVFQNDDLCSIILYAPDEKFRKKAFERLLKQEPSNYDLRYVACYAPDEQLRKKAFERLLLQNPSNYDLCYIVCHSSDENLKIKAIRLLLEKNPSDDDLHYIICSYFNKNLKEKVRTMIK